MGEREVSNNGFDMLGFKNGHPVLGAIFVSSRKVHEASCFQNGKFSEVVTKERRIRRPWRNRKGREKSPVLVPFEKPGY